MTYCGSFRVSGVNINRLFYGACRTASAHDIFMKPRSSPKLGRAQVRAIIFANLELIGSAPLDPPCASPRQRPTFFDLHRLLEAARSVQLAPCILGYNTYSTANPTACAFNFHIDPPGRHANQIPTS